MERSTKAFHESPLQKLVAVACKLVGMKEIDELQPGEHGWLAPEDVYLTPNGDLYIHAHARVATDQERNDAWLASGGARDVADTLVERTRGGDIVVDAAYYRRFSRVVDTDGALPDGALPSLLRDPRANPLPCSGCGVQTPRALLVPATAGGGSYCTACDSVIPFGE